MTPGQIAYDSYRIRSGGVSLVSGWPIPEWVDLPKLIRDGWESAAKAVAESLHEPQYVQVDKLEP